MVKEEDLVTGKIESLAFGGEGILKIQGLVIFVPFTAPGDEISCLLTKIKKNHGFAKIENILAPSKDRTLPKCPYFGTCGGCKLQHIDYETELNTKRQWVKDAFNRIGNLTDIHVNPVTPSLKEYAYRRHVSLTLKKEDASCFAGYVTIDQSSLFQANECPIFVSQKDPVLKELQVLVKNFDMNETHAKVTVLKDLEGYILHFHFKNLPKNAKKIVEEFAKEKTSFKGIVLASQNEYFSFGKTTSEIDVDGLNITFTSGMFMQNNPEQSLNIYRHIEAIAKKEMPEEILDLYCGIGISSLMLARNGIQVTGIECNHTSIKMAVRNAKSNKIAHAKFIHAPVENALAKIKIPDFVIINPPREGLDSTVIEALKKKLPKRIVYISCMPSTLARDIKLLGKENYTVEDCTPYDMFPQTAHVETVISLVRTQ